MVGAFVRRQNCRRRQISLFVLKLNILQSSLQLLTFPFVKVIFQFKSIKCLNC